MPRPSPRTPPPGGLELFALSRGAELLPYARRELTRIGDEMGLPWAAELEKAR